MRLLGCVYGLKHKGEILAAAKVYRYRLKDGEGVEKLYNDPIEALKQIGAFYGSSVITLPNIKLACLFMRYESGVPLVETDGYRDIVGKTNKFGGPWKWKAKHDEDGRILEFYSQVAKDCAFTAARYATESGMSHDDLNFGSILFPRNYPATRRLVFVDWDSWDPSQGARHSHDRAWTKIALELNIYDPNRLSKSWESYLWE
ncbi:hypothetical protein FRC03_007277 [Tulasnella sp. 419]|nr:hypothetical protein FRC03_007277 [Tulasnella sp. 419]